VDEQTEALTYIHSSAFPLSVEAASALSSFTSLAPRISPEICARTVFGVQGSRHLNLSVVNGAGTPFTCSVKAVVIAPVYWVYLEGGSIFKEMNPRYVYIENFLYRRSQG